jgi:hypothetical protein
VLAVEKGPATVAADEYSTREGRGQESQARRNPAAPHS